MDGSDPNKNAIYGALIGIGVAFVFVMSIRHFICMDMRIFPAADDAADADADAADAAHQEQEQEQQEDPL